MSELRVLPPGGGGPDDPDEPDDFGPHLVGPKLDRAMEFAERLRPRERRFAEAYILNGDSHEALFAPGAWPELRQGPAKAINQQLGRLVTNPNVRAYVEHVRGFGGLTIGLAYATVLLQLWAEGTNEDNPGYVRAQALGTLAAEMRQAGIAQADGHDKPDKKQLGKGEAGAVPKENADQWLELLSSSPPVPKKLGGGEAG